MLDAIGRWKTRLVINESVCTEPPTRRDHDVG